MIAAGIPVEYLLLFAPHKPTQFSAPCGLDGDAFQFSRTGDFVSSDQSKLGMKGIMVGKSVYGTIESATLFNYKNGNSDGKGNHGIETYTDLSEFKKDHPDIISKYLAINEFK